MPSERQSQLESQVNLLKQTLGAVQGENERLAHENERLSREKATTAMSDRSAGRADQLERELATFKETTQLQAEQIAELQLRLASSSVTERSVGLKIC